MMKKPLCHESVAQQVVKALLENEAPVMPQGRMVRIKTPKGDVQGHWNGYYDFREIGQGLQHSVGYPDNEGGYSHGWLHPGDELLDQVPSFDEWDAERKQREKERQERIAAMKQQISSAA